MDHSICFFNVRGLGQKQNANKFLTSLRKNNSKYVCYKRLIQNQILNHYGSANVNIIFSLAEEVAIVVEYAFWWKSHCNLN